MTGGVFFLNVAKSSAPISKSQGKLKLFKPPAPFFTTELGLDHGLKVQQRITDIVIFDN